MDIVQSAVKTFRDFTRFYTSIITFIEKGLPGTPYSFPEIRVLCELYEIGATSATNVLHTVKMDKGHLSRVILRLSKVGVVSMQRNENDRRFLTVALTPKGIAETEELLLMYDEKYKEILSNMISAKQSELIRGMTTVKTLLEESHNPARMKYKPGLKTDKIR